MTTPGQRLFCPRCGAHNEAGSQFCFRCGSALDAAPPPNEPRSGGTAGPGPTPQVTPLVALPAATPLEGPRAMPFTSPSRAADPASGVTPWVPVGQYVGPSGADPFGPGAAHAYGPPDMPTAVRPPAQMPGPPPTPSRRGAQTAIITGVVVVLLGAGAVTVFALTGHKTKRKAVAATTALTHTHSTDTFPNGLPTGSASPSDTPQPIDTFRPTETSAPVFPDSASLPSATASDPTPGATTIDGSDGSSYPIQIYYADRIVACGYHAYGTPAKTFLGAHRCQNGHRVLGIVDISGQQAVLSAITVTFGPQRGDPDGSNTAQEFEHLEYAPATGGMNDQLREGDYVPGVAHHIPSTEAFTVITEGSSVQIFDAWWLDGSTDDQDPTLVSMEQALAGTSLTPSN